MKFPKPTPHTKDRKRLRHTSSQLRTNRERKRWLHETDFGGGIEHDAYVRAFGCMSTAHHVCAGSIQAAHLTSRGAGGKWWDLIGLCDTAHRLQESGKLSEDAMAHLRSRARTLTANHLRAIGAI